MQLELQNLWRPAATVFVLGWLLTIGLGINQAMNHLTSAFQQLQYPSQTSSTTNIPKPVNIDDAFIADILLMTLAKTAGTQKIVVYFSFLGLFLQGISFSPIKEKSGNRSRKSL
jgi:hypothetical protein